MKQWPLRWQLALLTMSLVAMVLMGAGVLASWHLYREGVADLDEDLASVAHGILANKEFTAPDFDWSRHAVLRELLPPGHHLYLVEIHNYQGALLHRARELGSTPMPDPENNARVGTIHLHERPMRYGRFEQHGLVVKLAMGMHSVREARLDLLRGYLIGGPLVLLVVALGGWWIARRALLPVEAIVASAERITARQLDQRLPVPVANDELRRLTNVLNHMIDRLAVSFRQAMRFTADASHELKTPLTIIRGELESALRGGGLTHPQEKLLVNLLEETERLTRITEALLLLSRADAGHLRIDPHPADLAGMMQEILEDAEILAAPWGITIHANLPARAELMADTNFLRQLLLNLLDNAIKYNEQGGRVQMSVERVGNEWLVRIGNTGPGIPRGTERTIFDRFSRGDESRNRGRSGHGLGLSICWEIARAHGGEIRLDNTRLGWTEFQLILPAEMGTSRALPAAPGEPAGIDRLTPTPSVS